MQSELNSSNFHIVMLIASEVPTHIIEANQFAAQNLTRFEPSQSWDIGDNHLFIYI